MTISKLITREEKDLIEIILKELQEREAVYAKELLDPLIAEGVEFIWGLVHRLDPDNGSIPEMHQYVEVTARANILTTWELCILEQRHGFKNLDSNLIAPNKDLSKEIEEYRKFLVASYMKMADYINKQRDFFYSPMADTCDLIPIYQNPDIETSPSPINVIRKYEDVARMILFSSEHEKIQAVLSAK